MMIGAGWPVCGVDARSQLTDARGGWKTLRGERVGTTWKG